MDYLVGITPEAEGGQSEQHDTCRWYPVLVGKIMPFEFRMVRWAVVEGEVLKFYARVIWERLGRRRSGTGGVVRLKYEETGN